MREYTVSTEPQCWAKSRWPINPLPFPTPFALFYFSIRLYVVTRSSICSRTLRVTVSSLKLCALTDLSDTATLVFCWLGRKRILNHFIYVSQVKSLAQRSCVSLDIHSVVYKSSLPWRQYNDTAGLLVSMNAFSYSAHVLLSDLGTSHLQRGEL